MPPSPAVNGYFSHTGSHLSWTACTSYGASGPGPVAVVLSGSLIALTSSSVTCLVAQKNPPGVGGLPLWLSTRKVEHWSERLAKKKARTHDVRVAHARLEHR